MTKKQINEMERFKNEILDEIIEANNPDTQENLFSDGPQNKAVETLEPDPIDTRQKDTGVPGAEVKDQPGANQPDIESGKDEKQAPEPEIKKKDGRGRPSLTAEEKAERLKKRQSENGTEAGKQSDPETKEPAKKPVNAQADLMTDLSKYKNVTQSQSVNNHNGAPLPAQIDLSKYISGALLLICLDAIMPGIVLKIASFVDAKYKRVKPRKLKMTKEERDELEPLADEMVKLLFGFVHPAIAFLIATAVIYAGKLFTLDESDFEPVKLNVVKDGKKK